MVILRIIIPPSIFCVLLTLVISGCATENDSSLGPLSEEERESIPGQIAFISERSRQSDIYVINPTGEGLKRLTRNSSKEYPLQMKPDDARLLAVRVIKDSLGYREQLIAIPLDTTKAIEPVGPASARLRYPHVMNGGGSIVAAAMFGSFRDIYQISLTGDSLRRLTDNEEGNFYPAVSPDGHYIAFASSRDRNLEIYRMNVDGSKEERLTHFFRDDWNPKLSPDGQSIAFLSDRVVGKDRIFVMKANGDSQRRLNVYPDSMRRDTARFKWQESQYAWSPSVESIVYVRSVIEGPAQIWVTEVASGNRRRLSPPGAYDTYPTWSTGGAYIAFVSGKKESADLFIMRADGTGRTQLTTARGNDWLPRWLRLNNDLSVR